MDTIYVIDSPKKDHNIKLFTIIFSLEKNSQVWQKIIYFKEIGITSFKPVSIYSHHTVYSRWSGPSDMPG